MSKQYLVIVESPAKAKTIGKYLGKEYTVKACMGHLRDLPKSTLGVDPEQDFEPVYQPIKGKEDVIKDLKKSAWVRRRMPLESVAEAAVEMPEVEDSPVLRAVQALPEKYRQAVYLRYYEEYEVEEIADLMGCRAPQVSTYLYRGKQKLKIMLGGTYGQQCLSE